MRLLRPQRRPMPATLTVSAPARFVRQLELANPTKANALDDGLLQALDAQLAEPRDCRAWLLSAAGEGPFSGGFDLDALGAAVEGPALPDARLSAVTSRLAEHPIPSVAVVEGPAVGGGCELALSCDFVVAGPRASFLFPPAKLGIAYARQGLERVARRAGWQVARRMFLLATPLSADEALELGLIDVRSQAPGADALALAQRLASMAPLAISGMKSALSERFDDQQRHAYEQLRRRAFFSADAREARLAMKERRPPTFTGE